MGFVFTSALEQQWKELAVDGPLPTLELGAGRAGGLLGRLLNAHGVNWWFTCALHRDITFDRVAARNLQDVAKVWAERVLGIEPGWCMGHDGLLHHAPAASSSQVRAALQRLPAYRIAFGRAGRCKP